MYYFILAFIAGIFWGICTVIEKFKLLKYFEPYDLLIIRSFSIIFIFFILLFKKIKNTKSKLIEKMLNIDKKTSIILLINSILSITGSFLYFFILRENKVVNTVSTIYAVSTASPIILAYLFFNEIINIYEEIGTGLIIIGLYLVNFEV